MNPLPATIDIGPSVLGPIKLGRLPAIDLLRGFIMVLMAVDHARDFWSATPFRPEDVTQTSLSLFATRWVTHLCAPVFVLLAGSGAYLLYKKTGDRVGLSRFLFTRGLWLMFLDVTVLTLSWEFGYNFVFLQVIWVIGCSMVILAGLVWLPRWAIASFAMLLILGHNALDGWQPETDSGWWKLLHQQGVFLINQKFPVFVAYPLLPWPGVMAAGYWLGGVFDRPTAERNRWLSWVGAGLLVGFVILRFSNLYGDPHPWAEQARGSIYTVLSFLNVTKYPPSLLYLSVTMGLSLLMLSQIDRLRGGLRRVLLVYGRVPLFFYLLHILLLHGAAALWAYFQYGKVLNLMFDKPETWPAAYAPNLGRMYAVWLVTLVIMYYACRWHGNIKRRYDYAWLSYL